jgi:S-(hydroxymethyl)glutathione dehydrogenase/alcohol dehydrogenase
VLDVGHVLVQVHHSGICGSQLGEIDGAKGEDRYLPHLLGHEASGTVIDTGPGVRHVESGQKVVLHWRKGQGIDAAPPTYSWNGRRVNAGWVTTFNQYAVVSENRVTAIPDDSNLEVAALFGCAVTTGFGVVVNNAKLSIGESVVVFGAGGIGLNIVQAAALVSAYPIIAIDRFDGRLAFARSLGATHIINVDGADVGQEIEKIVGAAGPDVFIDNTGLARIIEFGYRITKPQGRIVLVGVPRQESTSTIHTLPLHFGKSLIGSHGGETIPQQDIPRYHRLYRHGLIRLDEIITDRFSLDQINEAIFSMRSGKANGRCLIAMD